MNNDALRRVPQLEKLLQAVGDAPGLPRLVQTQLSREFLTRIRHEAANGQVPADFPILVTKLRSYLETFARSRLQPVINGTGVLIHTNLGRSPLGEDVSETLRDIASSYNNLEMDLDTGERGKRGRFTEKCLAVLCGAEAATVVNNCAAALVLILRTFANGDKREVVISRGQLVEIGGGFRVPEIMETSGAILKEVGATNKTSLADYRKAIGPQTSMLLRVHRSNFYMDGFVSEPNTQDLATLAAQHKIPMVEDLGSGAFVNTEKLATIEHETTPSEVIAQGADLVCFSGDKLFGGPQAGIIVGKAEQIAALKKDPFFRALRCDKLILGVLQETVSRYLHHMAEGRTAEQAPLPLIEMLRTPLTELESRGTAMLENLTAANLPATCWLGEGLSRPGGGTMPRSVFPSKTLRIKPSGMKVEILAHRLRTASLPLMGYLEDSSLCLDLRTIFPRQDQLVVEALKHALTL